VSAVQPVQTARTVLHTGVAPVHARVLLAEHWPHAPVAWHAGVLPPQLASLTQGPQVPLVGLHVGVAPVHWVPLEAEHWPHAPLA
jgi:hypothetical protein